jgi:hypothetical protein
LIKQAQTVEHMLTHFPMNPHCEACRRAKTQRKHCRRIKQGDAQATVSPKKFGDNVTGDHIDCSGDGVDKGLNGERYGFVLYDRATGWLDVYPMGENVAGAIQAAMDDLGGPKDRVTYFYSDGGRELIKAAKYMGWTHGISTPGRPETNGVAEAPFWCPCCVLSNDRSKTKKTFGR